MPGYIHCIELLIEINNLLNSKSFLAEILLCSDNSSYSNRLNEKSRHNYARIIFESRTTGMCNLPSFQTLH